MGWVVNLRQWALAQGVHPQTAYRWFREGTLPVPAVRLGPRTILVNPEGLAAAAEAQVCGAGLYARVSSSDQKNDLQSQALRLSQYAAKENIKVVSIVSEVGSGMSGKRPKLQKLLSDPHITTIIVEHKDRLGRMNVELVQACLAAHDRHLIVIDPDEVESDLVSDMVEVLTSFCARLYGKRGAKNRAVKALQCAANPQSSGDVA